MIMENEVNRASGTASCMDRGVEQMADKRGFVRRNRGIFNSNTRPSHTNKKLQERYFEAVRHR